MHKSDANPRRVAQNGSQKPRENVELDLLRKASKTSGKSLAFWSSFTDGLDEKSLSLLAARAHMISSDISKACKGLQRDQEEAASLFSQVGDRDRKTILTALRDLVGLRNGQLI